MDSDITEMFAQPQLAEEWIERTKCNAIPWVRTKQKSYFDLVRFHGFYKLGILKVGLSRQRFAKLLMSTCKSALDASDSESSLKSIMDVFPYKSDLRKRTQEERKEVKPEFEWSIELRSDSHIVHKLLNELDAAYQRPLPKHEDPPQNTIENRINDYLKILVDESRFAEIFHGKTYGRYTPAISLEIYQNQGFKDAHDPSFIRVFEIVEGTVSDSKINELHGRYSSDSRIKLYIASDHSFDTRAQSIANDHRVSLVLVNPNCELTDDCFITSRSVALYETTLRNNEMLRGARDADVPFVIAYEGGVTNSLADVLAFHQVPVKKGFYFEAPRLKDSTIEDRAMKLVNDKVQQFKEIFESYHLHRTIPTYEVDPGQMLRDMGYQICEDHLSDNGQLALIDLKKKTVTIDMINPDIIGQRRSRKFSLAHELGHAVLHSRLNVSSLGESENTLSHSAFATKTEHQWLEHQANTFAACLLMPEDVIGYLYDFFYQVRFGRTDNPQPLYIINNNPAQWKDFFVIAGNICKYIDVSVAALKYRMIKLGLLIIREESFHIRDLYRRLNVI